MTIPGLTLTGRNTTGPSCSVGRPTAGVLTVHVHGGRPAWPPAAFPRRIPMLPVANRPARQQRYRRPTDDDDRHPRAKQQQPIRRASNNPVAQLLLIIQPKVCNFAYYHSTILHHCIVSPSMSKVLWSHCSSHLEWHGTWRYGITVTAK